MFGTVFGSLGAPFAPWHAAQSCTLASMPSWAFAAPANAAMTPAAIVVQNRRVNIKSSPRERSWCPMREYPHNGARGAIARDAIGLRLADALADIGEGAAGEAAEPARRRLRLLDPAGLEIREPRAEFREFGRRQAQDRFFDVFGGHA